MAGFFDVLTEPPVPLGEAYPLFNRISIETSSFCNRKCVFCPVSTGRRDPEATGGTIKYMDMGLYAKIVNELGSYGFKGVAQMFLLNEPLLDKRLADMTKMLKDACPKSSTYLSTNGDPIYGPGASLDKAIERMLHLYDHGINVINLNVYDEGEDQFNRYTELVAALTTRYEVEVTENRYRHHTPSKAFVALTDMRINRLSSKATDQFYQRGMNNRKPGSVKQSHCARTQRHLVVLYDGHVPICCAIDPTDLSLKQMGDLNEKTLWEIWQSADYFKYRYYTQQAKRVLPGCSTCDHKMSYPHVVRHVTASPEFIAKWDAEVKQELSQETV